MAKVVLYTFAIFKETRHSEYNKGFNDRNPFVYVSAENTGIRGPVWAELEKEPRRPQQRLGRAECQPAILNHRGPWGYGCNTFALGRCGVGLRLHLRRVSRRGPEDALRLVRRRGLPRIGSLVDRG